MNNPNLLLDEDKVEELMSWLEKAEDKELIEEIIVKSIDKINKGIREKEYKELVYANIDKIPKEKAESMIKKLIDNYIREDKVEEIVSWLEKTEDKELIEEIIVKSIDKINKGIKEKEYKEIIDKNIGRATKEKETEFLKKLLYIYKEQESRYDTIQLICRLLYLDPSDLSLLYDLSVELFNIKEFEKNKIIELLEGYRNKILNIKIKNALLNEIEILQRKYILKSKPRNLQIVLTTNCNLDCIMCGLPRQHYSLSSDTKASIISYMPYLEKIIWQGGEPLLYPNFKDLLKITTEYDIEQTITTNGLLLDQEFLDTIKSIKSKIYLNMSIDATDSETYSKIRRKGDFKLLENNIDLLNKNNLPPNIILGMQVVVMKSNYKKIESIVDFAVQNGFKSLLFQKLNPTYLAVKEDLSIEENNFVYDKIKTIKEHLIATNIHIDIESNINFIQQKAVETEQVKSISKMENKKQKHSLCLAPWKRMYIGYVDGRMLVLPACHCVIGTNINSDKNEDLWNGSELIYFRKQILNGNFTDCSFCLNSGGTFKKLRECGC